MSTIPEKIGSVKISENEYDIVRGRYPAGDAIYIVLNNAKTNSTYAIFSVNLISSDKLGKNEFCVKTWSENADLVEPMKATGLFEDTGRSTPTGYVISPIWKIKD